MTLFVEWMHLNLFHEILALVTFVTDIEILRQQLFAAVAMKIDIRQFLAAEFADKVTVSIGIYRKEARILFRIGALG